ncbi:MAG: hypothetical protein FKY71_10535 [Spiribacter salinus]|uniref:Uncharacterized protein n=1 Tax=Spiribacter salinus TaxID=1335746 RepID=A0A540VQL3_9GAMM|nr:MAG: hypothetical protein FKY71_10535 [Spiribacter salinus]
MPGLLLGSANRVYPLSHPDGDQWNRPNDAKWQLALPLYEAERAATLINPWSGACVWRDYSNLTQR